VQRFARAFAAVAAVALAGLAGQAAAQAPSLVFIVRHAEKAAAPANDPVLSPAGEARVHALVDLLANSGIGAVISTPFARTVGTAKPVADKFGVRVDSVAVGADVPAHAQAVAAQVRRYPGKAVLVVGHSNTVTAIAAALGAPAMPDLCDGDYDQIFILELQVSGPPRVVRARFGAPAADEKCGKMD